MPPPAAVCPAPARAFGFSFFFFSLFFLFFQKKKRKNQRKETLTGRGMRASQRAGLPFHTYSVFSLRGFSERKAPQNIFCGKSKFR